MTEKSRQTYVPALFIPLMFVWYSVEPALLWLIYLWNGKRIARFLNRANNGGMTEKPPDRFLPRRPEG